MRCLRFLKDSKCRCGAANVYRRNHRVWITKLAWYQFVTVSKWPEEDVSGEGSGWHKEDPVTQHFQISLAGSLSLYLFFFLALFCSISVYLYLSLFRFLSIHRCLRLCICCRLVPTPPCLLVPTPPCLRNTWRGLTSVFPKEVFFSSSGSLQGGGWWRRHCSLFLWNNHKLADLSTTPTQLICVLNCLRFHFKVESCINNE